MQMEQFTYYGQPVRAAICDDKTWFVGVDIAEILGFEDPEAAVFDLVDDAEKVPMMAYCEEHDHDYMIELVSFKGALALLREAKEAGRENTEHFRDWLIDVTYVICCGGLACDEGED